MYFYTETEKHITKCSQTICQFVSIPDTVQELFLLYVKVWGSIEEGIFLPTPVVLVRRDKQLLERLILQKSNSNICDS